MDSFSMGNQRNHQKTQKCRETNTSMKLETGKLVKAGIPAQLIERFLKEVLEEKNID